MKYYVIQRITDSSYYSDLHDKFKGYLFAKYYGNKDEAIKKAKQLAGQKSDPVNIVTVLEVYK